MKLVNSAQGSVPNSSSTPDQRMLTPEQEKELKYAAGGVLALGYLGSFTAELLNEYGVCLNNIVPSSIQKAIELNNFILSASKIPLLALPDSLIAPADILIASPIVEEFEVRFLFQEVLLRRLPKSILNKYGPQYSHLVDAKTSKIARIALSSLLFGLMHITRAADHENQCLGANYGFAVLGLGAFSGYLTERTGGIGPSILFHMARNIISYTVGATNLG